MGTRAHIRTGVEDLGGSQKKYAEYVNTTGEATHTDSEAKLGGITNRVEEAIPQLVEAKLISIQGALDKTREGHRGRDEVIPR